MTTCKDCIDLLLNYLDGELVGERKAKLEEHLGACGPCEDFIKTYRATPGVCKQALGRAMPTGLAQKLSDFLRSEITKPEKS